MFADFKNLSLGMKAVIAGAWLNIAAFVGLNLWLIVSAVSR